ncbi:hypothetical protein MRX96_029641 [Rhipicephalus microplus]
MPVGALEQYLDVLDRRMRAEKRVVAVFLTPDVAEAVSSDFKNIRLFSLGCSSMSNRNSSDVSILKHFKQLYRTFLLRRFTVLNGQPVEARPTLLSAMSLITMSWDCLKQDIIRTAFKDWGFHGCILSHSAAAEQKQGDAAGHAVDTGNVLLDSFVWTDEEPVLKDVVVKLEPRDTVDETEQRQAGEHTAVRVFYLYKSAFLQLANRREGLVLQV